MHEDGRLTNKSGENEYTWKNGTLRDMDGNVVSRHNKDTERKSAREFGRSFEPETDSNSHDKSSGNEAMIKTKRHAIFDSLDKLSDLVDERWPHEKDTERQYV